MSKKVIVSIGREYGSGGRMIAKRLAKKLGFEFYDKDLLDKAIPEAGLDPAAYSSSDEKAPGLFITPYAPTKADLLYRAQSAYIKKIAEKDESCIIVGRCANSILAGRDDLISIFIYAPMEYKAKLCMENLPLDTSEVAKKECLKADRVRKNYYQYFTEYQWGARDGYNLLIDSSLLGIDGTADMLADIIRKKIAE